MSNAAIYYVPDGFDASSERLPVVGRSAAGEGFLKALAVHGGLDRLICFAATQSLYEDFRTRVQTLGGKRVGSRWIPWARPAELSDPGCLYLPDPRVAVHAWERRYYDQRSYSLCGITHTTAHNDTVDLIGALLTAPVQSWDALICTSRAVRRTIDQLLSDWGDYLEDRTGGRPACPAQLPVIPLGVDCDGFAPSPRTEQARATLREQLQIGAQDIMILYMGRLSFSVKSNPFPMLRGLELAARRTAKRIHLVQAGWFESETSYRAFVDAVQQFCPGVNSIFVDGRRQEIRSGIWHAADIFTSLVDNVQETFGISPIEAMAAGLPAVVSDWDGYRDTVVDGETGFRVRTLLPQPGSGEILALRFQSGLDTYPEYLTHASASCAIDIEECADRFVRLADDADLRRRLGEAGRKRARELFDWSVVIKAYQALWTELEQRRRSGTEAVPRRDGAPHHPLRQDPFRLFECYPSGSITPNASLSIAQGADSGSLARLREAQLFKPMMSMLLPANDCADIMRGLAKKGPRTVANVLESFDDGQRARVQRTVAWLAKVGLLRVAESPAGSADDGHGPGGAAA